MRRSALVDGLLLTAVLASTMSLLVFLRAIPKECPDSNVSGIEEPAAPCLVSDREDFRRIDPSARAGAGLINAPLRQNEPIALESGRAEPERDVESTGAIPPTPR
jgi:hypothetical protein